MLLASAIKFNRVTYVEACNSVHSVSSINHMIIISSVEGKNTYCRVRKLYRLIILRTTVIFLVFGRKIAIVVNVYVVC